MKDKILTNKENSRLNLYGGCFDLVNGTFLSNKISSYLKFAALFYDKIIVPDGFFIAMDLCHVILQNISKIQIIQGT